MLFLIRIIKVSISGLLPILPVVGLLQLYLVKSGRAKPGKPLLAHIAGVCLFCFSLVGVLAITAVPDAYHLRLDPAVNFVPFVDIRTNTLQYLLNILLFAPVGFLLPMLWRGFQKKSLTFLGGFLFSLLIEVVQLFGNRVTDLDDLLMNTAGTVLGYGLFSFVKRLYPEAAVLFAGGWRAEAFVCFGLAWGSVMLVPSFLTPVFV